jgi:hypothetical protein
MLSHNVIFRRPAIVTLALQPFLPNGVVGYFIDLEVSHVFDISDRPIDGPASATKVVHTAVPPALTTVNCESLGRVMNQTAGYHLSSVEDVFTGRARARFGARKVPRHVQVVKPVGSIPIDQSTK